MNNQQQIKPEDLPQCTGAILSTKHFPEKKLELHSVSGAHYMDEDGVARKVSDHEAMVRQLSGKKAPSPQMAKLLSGIGQAIKADPMAGLFDPDLVREGKEAYGLGQAPKRKQMLVHICVAYPYTSRQTRMRRELTQLAQEESQRRQRERQQLIAAIRGGVRP